MGGRYRLLHAGVEPSVGSAQGLQLSGLELLPGTVGGSERESGPPLGPDDIVVVPGIDSERLDELAASIPGEWLALARAPALGLT